MITLFSYMAVLFPVLFGIMMVDDLAYQNDRLWYKKSSNKQDWAKIARGLK